MQILSSPQVIPTVKRRVHELDGVPRRAHVAHFFRERDVCPGRWHFVTLVTLHGAPWNRMSEGVVGAARHIARRRSLTLREAQFLLFYGYFGFPRVAQAHAVAPLVLVIAGIGIGCAMFFPAALTIPVQTVPEDRAAAAYPVLHRPGAGDAQRASAVTALGLAAAFTLRSR